MNGRILKESRWNIVIIGFFPLPVKAKTSGAGVEVSTNDVIYVAPSPQLTPGGIVVYFLVRDSNGASQDFQASSSQEAQAQALILALT